MNIITFVFAWFGLILFVYLIFSFINVNIYIYIFFYPTGSAIYGVAAAPNDFATYLLAILIVNGLLYLAFYVIMKVLPSSVLINLPT